MSNSIKTISENILSKISRESLTPDRQKTSGVVSKNSGSCELLSDNGNVQLMSGNNNQSKMNNESSTITDISLEHNIITNRININTDDILINGSKINPQLYGLSNIVQQSDNCIQGDLNMIGTVLVKSWEKSLNKFVYIRRYIRTPILYNTSTVPVIDERFDIYSADNI